MPAKRKYTNATFAKRVDHAAGRHRPSRAMAEPVVCEDCGAVYANRRWTTADSKPSIEQQKHWRPQLLILCPACQQKQTGEPRGFLYLSHSLELVRYPPQVQPLLCSRQTTPAAQR